jgi:hypothetical protein
MQMKVTQGYLVKLANYLAQPDRIFGGKCSGRVAYSVYMNSKVAKTYLDAFAEAFPPDPKWQEYSFKHDQVYVEAKVSTMEQLMALPPEQQAEIQKRISEIDAEYKDVIEKEQATEKERQKLLDEEVEVDLRTVTPDDIEIVGPDSWKIWTELFNGENGFIRGEKTEG